MNPPPAIFVTLPNKSVDPSHRQGQVSAPPLGLFAIRLEAIATMVEAIAIWFETIVCPKAFEIIVKLRMIYWQVCVHFDQLHPSDCSNVH